MKIKTYTAPTVAEAIALIRKDFGSDVLIISNQHIKDGVRLTIGVEEDSSFDAEIEQALFGEFDNQTVRTVRQALERHRVPDVLIERLLLAVRDVSNTTPANMLGVALGKVFRFYPLPIESQRAFLLVGANGAGKTIAVAKMAVRAKMAGKRVGVITTDMKRAGAVEQLAAFTKILDVELVKVRQLEDLKETLDVVRAQNDLVVIDSFGVNPFAAADMNALMMLKKDIEGLEPVLVMSAGWDAWEASDVARAFLPLGCKRLLATRLDMARRFGSILHAALENNLGLTDVGISPHVSQGLCPIDAVALAQMMLSKE